MPMPTIPGIPPETWEVLLQIIGQLNTSIVELQEQGITTFEQLRQWLTLQGYELVEISEVVGYTVCKTTAVDPTTTTAVANRVATDIATTGGAGTAVAQFTTGGNRTLGLVSKVVAVGACLSLLVSTIGAGLVTDEIKEDLITSADPYTIDGENVPVLIDENGKTHFLDEMVEAIRAKAIELGIFSSGGVDKKEESGLSYAQLPDSIFPFNTFTGYSRVRITGAGGEWYVVDSPNIMLRYNYKTNNGSRIVQTLLLCSDENNITATVNGTPTTYNANTFTHDGKTVYWVYIDRVLYASQADDYPSTPLPEFDLGELSVSTGTNQTLAWLSVYNHGAGGVEGITPAQDLITAGVADVTKPLAEVLPQLATGQMSIASPNENDLTHKSNWYPVSINSEDVFTDGATEEETSSATDGDVKQDLQPAILDAINELIKQLNPEGIPDVPVSDSGDTPPENPPLIPPSDGTGSNGLWSIYNPTLTQVHNFGAWLWSDTLADQFKRIFNSPIDGVIGFHMLYCTPTKGTAKNIKCGFLDSGVLSDTVANPYVDIDCGTVTITEYYRNALDYDNTRISIYLPFVGIIPLDTNVVMGSSLNVKYRVDVLTGTCLAQIKVIKENSDAVMYAYEGNCAVQIPLTSTTYTGMVGALISGVSAGLSLMTGNIGQTVASGVNALASGYSGLSGVKQSGSLGSNAGALGIRIPYVMITHPVSVMPYMFNTIEGIPSNSLVRLSSLTGFTRVRAVHLEDVGPATDEEVEMIKEYLQEGVII